MRAGVWAQIRGGQFEQRTSRAGAVLLQVNKSARQLDQPLVKSAVGPLPFFEPKLFQDIVRLVKLPAIKAVEIPPIVRFKPAGGNMPNQSRDSFSFGAHRPKIKQILPKWNENGV
jgi:hypothetical protein